MKLGIAGAGMIVKESLGVLKSLDIKLEGICATKHSEDKLKKLSKEYNIANYYTDFDEMLKNNEIDTVYVALPNILHYEFCKKALEAGKNVICEKPFTVKLRELEELFELAKEKKLILIEAITTLYLENFLEIKKLIKNGDIGDVKMICANFSQYSSRYENFKNGIISPSFDPKFAGGSLMDLNIYNIHFVCGIFGAPREIKYIPCIENNIDVSGVLVLSYRDKECVCIASKSSNCSTNMQIQGTKATISMSGPTNGCESFTVFENKNDIKEYNYNRYSHRMSKEFIEIEKIIDNKDYKKAEKMMINSLIVMEVIDRARESL
ncbi:MAG: Gfo/Idh/MocA family oxidoreductase [Peptostreptococcus sp.]|uniref:Gfo/Idh/MocA family protein n=1 Tax=Peptostreptococcus sp. TaxID=1262 RepID=UPI002FC608F7